MPVSSLQRPTLAAHNPQAYHSAFNQDTSVRQVGNTAILPITTKIRGPAPLSCELGTQSSY